MFTAPLQVLKGKSERVRDVGIARLIFWTLTFQLKARLHLRREMALIEKSGLFDASWYTSQYPDVAQKGPRLSPVLHYLLSGAGEGRDPNPFFDTSWYLERYPDIVRAGLNPLVHYILSGASEGREPNPSFNTALYLDRHPEVVEEGLNPLAHFLRWIDYFEISREITDRRADDIARVAVTRPEMISLDEGRLQEYADSLKFTSQSAPEVSIVIPVHNQLKLTLECLTSVLERTEGVPFELIIVSDGSTDATRDILPRVSNILFLENTDNLGFLLTCNRGAARARGRYLVFLNNDVQVIHGWLRALLDTFTDHPHVGAVGPKIIYPDGRLQEAGARINSDGSTRFVGLHDDPQRPRYNYAHEVDYCSAVCLMIPTQTFLELGGFNDELAPAYYEDVDLCLRVRAGGLRILYNPGAVVIHHLSASSDALDPSYKLECVTRNRQKIVEKWLPDIEALNRVRLIAFYLPQYHQYHPIPENNYWWGRGFTEWTKVTSAKRSFAGHYQPHLPSDLGSYDLRLAQVMEEQAALARRYGIHGFCYYYSWFNGKRLLEMPLERLLTTGKPDIPFCLCWANENWTRRWDGRENEILIAQAYSDENDEAFILDLIRYFQHPNYIRIEGRPVLLIYRVELLPDVKRTAETWRRVCRERGVGEIYLASVESFKLATKREPPYRWGFDATVEFPPHESACPAAVPGELYNPRFSGVVSDYRDLVLNCVRREVAGWVRFRTVVPSWDNTARRPDDAFIFHRSSPGAFQAWLEAAMEETCDQNSSEERVVFLNAWNEWAEGNHLEPDQLFGHGYLEAVRNACDRMALRRARSTTSPR